mgnify:CR=1 FL=1
MCLLQAEDGIRDLVRSRGLGDVYKRQGCAGSKEPAFDGAYGDAENLGDLFVFQAPGVPEPVSYTHLTLPTSDLV